MGYDQVPHFPVGYDYHKLLWGDGVKKFCHSVCVLNSRMAYQVISAMDWESDGAVGSVSIPVATTVTDNEGEVPCVTGQYNVHAISVSDRAINPRG